MYISHSVMEGQRHNNPLTRVAFVYNGPKGMELASQSAWFTVKPLGGGEDEFNRIVLGTGIRGLMIG